MRVKTEEKKNAIIAGATEVFLERGFEATSMSHIATASGLTKPTLYSYFASKESLFAEVMKHVATNALSDAFGQLDKERTLDEALKVFGENFISTMLQPELIKLRGIIMSEGSRSELGALLFSQGISSGINHLAAYLSFHMQNGILCNARPETAAAHLMGTLESEYQNHFLGIEKNPPSREKIRKSVEDAVAFFLRGYAPASTSCQPSQP
jgi:AcrR family transcriptional regulator